MAAPAWGRGLVSRLSLHLGGERTLAGQRAAVKAVRSHGCDGDPQSVCVARALQGWGCPSRAGGAGWGQTRCWRGGSRGSPGDCREVGSCGGSQTLATTGPNRRALPRCRVRAGARNTAPLAAVPYTAARGGRPRRQALRVAGRQPHGDVNGQTAPPWGCKPPEIQPPNSPCPSHSSGASLGPGHSRACP